MIEGIFLRAPALAEKAGTYEKAEKNKEFRGVRGLILMLDWTRSQKVRALATERQLAKKGHAGRIRPDLLCRKPVFV